MGIECDRMWVSSRWVYQDPSNSKSPKTPNPDYHPPILFHHDTQTGDAYFTDEGGHLMDPDTVPGHIKDDIKNNPVHVKPQFAPPNLRPYQVDSMTGQEFRAGQRIHQDLLQGVPLLNESRSTDIISQQNSQLAAQNKMLLERLEALEKAKVTPKKRGRPRKSKSQEAVA